MPLFNRGPARKVTAFSALGMGELPVFILLYFLQFQACFLVYLNIF